MAARRRLSPVEGKQPVHGQVGRQGVEHAGRAQDLFLDVGGTQECAHGHDRRGERERAGLLRPRRPRTAQDRSGVDQDDQADDQRRRELNGEHRRPRASVERGQQPIDAETRLRGDHRQRAADDVVGIEGPGVGAEAGHELVGRIQGRQPAAVVAADSRRADAEHRARHEVHDQHGRGDGRSPPGQARQPNGDAADQNHPQQHRGLDQKQSRRENRQRHELPRGRRAPLRDAKRKQRTARNLGIVIDRDTPRASWRRRCDGRQGRSMRCRMSTGRSGRARGRPTRTGRRFANASSACTPRNTEW